MPVRDENKLSLIYDKKQKDFVVKYPRIADGNLILSYILNNILEFNINKRVNNEYYCFDTFNLKDELEKRGYDLTTLKFSIKLKEKVH